MLGSERRSLLGGEIPRRETTAKDAVDQFLGKLVDTFNFQIQEQQLVSAQQQQLELKKDKVKQQQELKREAANGKAYVDMESLPKTEVLSPRAALAPAPVQTKSAFLLKKLSEKLSEFVLNEAIDQAAKENPMELGWARSSLNSGATTAQQQSSWFDQDQNDDDDLYFQTDDESSTHCSYHMMPKSNISGSFSL